MSILNFQKPDKILLQKATDFHGLFEFKPLEPGFGQTIGNSLRRVLLSSLEGYAVSAIRIAGVDHEFSSIPGVVEDVVDIILNINRSASSLPSRAIKLLNIRSTSRSAARMNSALRTSSQRRTCSKS
jgi:DNA-directed RNA polymerase alpha subunit